MKTKFSHDSVIQENLGHAGKIESTCIFPDVSPPVPNDLGRTRGAFISRERLGTGTVAKQQSCRSSGFFLINKTQVLITRDT